MHYFLGLEVWQQLGKIFLGQGKYEVDILKRFRIMECKSMSTHMNTNLKNSGSFRFRLGGSHDL
jgi:hypothetical protein